MIRKPRTISAGVGLLIAVALVSGCQPKVGTAAQVGDTRITTDQLNAATEAAAPSSSAASSAAPASAPTQDATLTKLIQHQLLLDLAKQRGVVVTTAEIDAVARQLKADNATKGVTQSDESVRLDAEYAATVVALSENYVKTGHAPDQAQVVVFPVADQKTADEAVAALNATPGDGLAIAAKYASDPSQVQHGTGQLSGLPPEVQALKSGQATVVSSQGTLTVWQVNKLLSTTELPKDLAAVSKVTVNPRFGSWDPKTIAVGPFVSEVVSPAPGATPAAAPSGAVPSAAAPSAAAPSS